MQVKYLLWYLTLSKHIIKDSRYCYIVINILTEIPRKIKIYQYSQSLTACKGWVMSLKSTFEHLVSF